MAEQITTAEELDALPVGSVVRDAQGDLWLRQQGGWGCLTAETHFTVLDFAPVAVLYRPDVPHPTEAEVRERVAAALVEAAEALNYGEAATIRSHAPENPVFKADPLLVVSTGIAEWLRERAARIARGEQR